MGAQGRGLEGGGLGGGEAALGADQQAGTAGDRGEIGREAAALLPGEKSGELGALLGGRGELDRSDELRGVGAAALALGGPDDAAPFLRFKPLSEAEQLWQQAEAAAANSLEFLERLRLGHLPVRYVWLSRWDKLRKECSDAGSTWPLPDSRTQVADDWMAVAKGTPGKPWTKVTLLNEGGLTPEKWAGRFQQDARKP